MKPFVAIVVALVLLGAAAAYWWLAVPSRRAEFHFRFEVGVWGSSIEGGPRPESAAPPTLYANERLLGSGPLMIDSALLARVGEAVPRIDHVPNSSTYFQELLRDRLGLEGTLLLIDSRTNAAGEPVADPEVAVELRNSSGWLGGFVYLCPLGWRTTDGALDSFLLIHAQDDDGSPGRAMLLRARRETGAWILGTSGGGTTLRDGKTLRAMWDLHLTIGLFHLPLRAGEPRPIEPEGVDRWWIEGFPLGSPLRR